VPRQKSISIQNSTLLLVEGKWDKEVFEALAIHLGLDMQVVFVGSYPEFEPVLRVLLALDNFSKVITIGIVRDADDDAEASFKYIQNVLNATGFSVPDKPMVSEGSSPAIAIMIVPPNGEGTGRMLEDLCFESVVNDAASKCINAYFDCLEDEGITVAPENIAKAKVQAFVASRYDPQKPEDKIIHIEHWIWNSPVFDIVKDFLKQVASPPP
jgi:hypothetical protein